MYMHNKLWFDKTLFSIPIQFKYIFADCSLPSPSFPLSVNPASANYNESGKFDCKNGGILFYLNGVPRNSNETRCNATAQWSGHDVLDCFTGKSTLDLMIRKLLILDVI